MRTSRTLLPLAIAVLLARAPRAGAAAFRDYGPASALRPVPMGSYGARAVVYEDSGVGVYVTHVKSGVRRPLFRSRAATLSVALHLVRRRKTLHRLFRRGDLVYQDAGEIGGGWLIGGAKGGNKQDMLQISYPPLLPQDLLASAQRGQERRRGLFVSMASARARLGAARSAAVLQGRAINAVLLNVRGAESFRNTSPGTLIVLPIDGRAAARAGAASGTLYRRQILAVDRGETLHVSPVGPGPVRVLLVWKER
ncbi:MAG: hypothetical protein KGM24_10505 [Elusimicrobia bacterium]|nr:hypothetical protein [Elusimicrobiota bacterium]